MALDANGALGLESHQELLFAPSVSWAAWAAAALLLLCLQLPFVRALGAAGKARPMRALTLVARLIGCAVLLWSLMGPVLRHQQGRPEARQTAVVLDDSRSMAQGVPASRQARARAVLQRLQQQAALPPTKLYDLAGACASAASCGQAKRGDSKLLEALQRAAGQQQAPAALVLISDGRDNERGEEGVLSASERAQLQRLGVPVSTIALSDPHEAYDLVARDVVQDPFTYVKTTSEVDCVIDVVGKARAPVVVQLRRGPDVVQSQTLALPTPPSRQGGSKVTLHAKFTLRAEQVGEQVYACFIVPQPHEQNAHNNGRFFSLRVLRDKIRVLHVVGRPSWDERFLRQELKNNRNVDVISFFILRTPDDDTQVPEAELSLIPFPVARLFTSELRNFDLIILQNFDFRPYHMGQYLENIRDAVRGGLGLVMLGGPESFAAGGYANTPLEEVLPMGLISPPSPPPPGRRTLLQATLAPAGLFHPVLQAGPGPAWPGAPMAQIPAVDGITALGPPVPGAQMLLWAQAEDGNGRWPLLASLEVGRGRTLAVASDGLWRWAYAPQAGDAPGKAYARLWHNAWRWLSHDPELQRVRVEPKRPTLSASSDGATLEGSVRALDANWQPLPGGSVRVVLAPHPQGPQLDGAQNASAAPPLQLDTDAQGQAHWRFAQVPPGVWQVEATLAASPPHEGAETQAESAAGPAAQAGAQATQKQGVATVLVHPSAEDAGTLADPAFMAAIAQATGGRVLGESEPWGPVPLAPRPPMRVEQQRERSAWAHLAVAALMVLAWSVAWASARRYGGR